MFRPTHFAILFAVVLCASALPAPPSSLAPEGRGGTPETGGLKSPSPKLPAAGSEGEGGPDKADLNTDATLYFGYSYYGPRWGYAPSWTGRSAGWVFGFGR